MTTIDALTAALLKAVNELPFEWFVLAGSFIEEVISPIPAYAIMVTAGSAARLQSEIWVWLLLLAALGAVGKTLACLIYYALAGFFEKIIIPRYGSYIGISHHDLQAVGKKLASKRADRWLLVVVR